MNQALTLSSPDGHLEATIGLGDDGRLQYSVRRHDHSVVEPSALGITVDGLDWGRTVTLGEPQRATIDETYPTRGWHTLARNHCHAVALPLTHRDSGLTGTLEARAYDDGFAYRYVLPGTGIRTVQGKRSSWKIPAGSRVWLAERNNAWKLKSYAGAWLSTAVDNLPKVSSQGPVQAPPLVIELPDGGYAALTEAALSNYSGMRLRALGERTVQADFTEGNAGFQVAGPIVTPWRVTIACLDLNGLVNSDLLTNLNPPPDPALFADTSFIKPGRAVWRWWSSGTGTPAQERQFLDYAVELGFEYMLVDDGWKDWPHAWQTLAELCQAAKARGVGVLVWKDYKDIQAPADDFRQLRQFLDAVQQAGASGVKIDFLNAESKDRIDFQTAALRETARRRLLLIFHGCQKATGESRTYPNEITREGIRGLELNKMQEGRITAAHNAALPFTRFVVGHGDYTPLGYSNPAWTTYAHQLATVVIFTSPLQVIAEHPEKLLRDPATLPALDVLKAMPSVWDETRVLPPSAIGKVAVFARRSGATWFLAALNGAQPVTLPKMNLSFLGNAQYSAVLLSSPTSHSFQRREVAASAALALDIPLKAGDGFVAVFRPLAK